MTACIALLRGINVGGRNQVAMSDLRDLLAGLGFVAPRSLLQTGNLVFRSDREPGVELEHLLEEAAAERLDLRTDFFIRTADEGQASSPTTPSARKPSAIPTTSSSCS